MECIEIKSFDSLQAKIKMIVSLPSRNQLLAWVSHLTNTTVQKLQELSDGVHFCQIFDKIYPKLINLNKLKRDAKVPLEKEKNFRILLNAINQLGLPVTINIIDLSNGKIAPTIEFLQWFYKQYKNPFQKNPPFEQKDERLNEPRMKSYVGNIFVSQKSCYKPNDLNPNLALSRRSLDSRVLQQKVFQPEKSKSVKSKNTRQSQPKEIIKSLGKTSRNTLKSYSKEKIQISGNINKNTQQSQQKENIQTQREINKNNGQSQEKEKILTSENISKNTGGSQPKENIQISGEISKNTQQSQQKENISSSRKYRKIISVTPNEAAFQQICKERRQETLQMRSKRKREFKDQTFQQILERTLNSQKPRLQRALIKVTEAALENNPELKATIQMLLQSGNNKKEHNDHLQLSPDSQVRNILNSYRNTSQKCEVDTLEQVEQEKNQRPIEGFNTNTFVVIQPISFSVQSTYLASQKKVQPLQLSAQSIFMASQKKENELDKKETVKKSMMKCDNENALGDILMSQKSIKQLSAQKQKNHNNFHELFSKPDQNQQENRIIISRIQQSNIFNPHQKVVNPETYVSEKKVEVPNGGQNDGNRQVQSEKIIIRENNNSLKSNQNFGIYPNLPN